MIVNIRGTNGSGKSHIVYELMKKYLVKPHVDDRGKVIGHYLGKNVYVIGRYCESTTCGGCDTIRDEDGIKSQDRVCARVQLATVGNFSVLFEGIIVSSVFERYYSLAQRLKPVRWVWAFMDTPSDVCILQVLKRNGGKLFKTKNLLDKAKSVEHSIVKLRERREEVVMIDYRNGVQQVEELLAGEL